MADSTSSMPVGSTGAGGGNMLRITGLNTGLDIDAMVKKMLTADQARIDKVKQQQQLIQWRQEAYQSIIKDVKDLQSTYFDITNSANYMLSSSSYNNMTAASSDATTVSGKAGSTAAAGTYKILVKQLASAATIEGTDTIKTTDGKDVTSSTKLSDLGISGKISLDLNYNNGGTAGSKTVTFDATESSTIQDLADAIKNQTGGAVTAKFNELTGQFSIQTSNPGSKSTISVTDSNNILSKFGVTDKTGTGNDALVAIKEPDSNSYIVSKQSSNNFTVNGVTYSILDVNSTDENISVDNVGGKFDTISASDTPTSISVTQDTSKVHDLITNFIDKYNNLVGEIQDKLSEKKDYDYAPLTDAQKDSMSDTDITNWEDKAKEGILRNDDNLEQLLNDLTSAFNTPVVDSSGKNVSTIYFGSIGSNSLGIDTSDDYSEGAKLSITDDQQFTDLLNNHEDEILKLFTTTSDSTDPTDKFNQSGIFQRISDIINNNVGVIGTTLNSGTLTKYANLQDDYSVSGGGGTGTLPDQIYQQQLLINTLTDRMNDDQTKYYNQFTQLETAMEQLNAQQSTLSMYLS
ncbi:MAG: flagellar filament capping protein FliD [Clostridium sp.]|uniref:flagellar filament capping protein FliD n=1 Tax=Clostridium sp. TaxID=1506 RepID=UPI0025C6E155|nr:flagellar filament capping protein FliD [Clostridium sp.]MCH3964325.1 flagellar filament capping protein FliD [Clostridium sp.]MCI1715500.1 flagellar filament capping protein FliD [Clostridium sp.]MCI1799708.1 flagellar filament capping protein FliD [Clostridium sp.]MCI1813684.1 flagellar filament capping protein FliD [Clostridium sp.]MCI1870521.1 flagellar filament capping protein FliD [Clostridium sp.]